MDIIIFIAAITLNVLISNTLAYIVSHLQPGIQVKPFNCYGCLAFWLTLIIGVFIALTQDDTYMALIIAVLCAFLNFYYVKSKYNILP